MAHIEIRLHHDTESGTVQITNTQDRDDGREPIPFTTSRLTLEGAMRYLVQFTHSRPNDTITLITEVN